MALPIGQSVPSAQYSPNTSPQSSTTLPPRVSHSPSPAPTSTRSIPYLLPDHDLREVTLRLGGPRITDVESLTHKPNPEKALMPTPGSAQPSNPPHVPHRRQPLTRSFWRPTAGLDPGLYESVIRARLSSQLTYYASSTLFNTALLLQLVLGATLTALSGTGDNHSTAITVLAAANTVTAGLLALLHNSGLPDRLKNNWYEFEKVEWVLRRLFEGGVVEVGEGEGVTVFKDHNEGGVVVVRVEQVVDAAFAAFERARDTVKRNRPASYISSPTPVIAGVKA